jgi:hypothetical protein
VTKPLSEKDMPEIFVKATQALREAVESAIAEHWRNGRPVYVWRDEQVVALHPDGTAVPVKREIRDKE